MAPSNPYPFAQEFITDANGQIQKVVLSLGDYQTLLAALEDEGLYRLMQQVRDEPPLDRESALQALDE
ncbi:MAG: hypothetical protein AAGD09_26455 [Cyanobacteria bacterium P01_F01_bin.56]